MIVCFNPKFDWNSTVFPFAGGCFPASKWKWRVWTPKLNIFSWWMSFLQMIIDTNSPTINGRLQILPFSRADKNVWVVPSSLSQGSVPSGKFILFLYKIESEVSILFPVELWTVRFVIVAKTSLQLGDVFEPELTFSVRNKCWRLILQL